MKKLMASLVFLPLLSTAQSQDQNYIKTTVYKEATNMALATPTPQQASSAVAYYDGLGRPSQLVSRAQSSSGRDIVKHIEYGDFGEQSRDYLPFVSAGATSNFDTNAQASVLAFYASPSFSSTGNPNFEATANPYAEKVYERSQLGRPLELATSGDGWNVGGGHTKKISYGLNAAGEVRRFQIVAAWNASSGLYDIPLTDMGAYPALELKKKVVKNENWVTGKDNTVEIFEDMRGKTVLKRTYESGVAHDTYYVHDQFGNETVVIPPGAAASSISQSVLDGLCFQYKYDARNRMSEKKLPGTDWQFMVYDKFNRMVMSGPALPPFEDLSIPNSFGWLAVKYDSQNRVAYTGWLQGAVSTTSRKLLQDERNLQGGNFNESRTASSTMINGVGINYSNMALPTAGLHVLRATYYDDYAFANGPQTFDAVEQQNVYYNNSTRKPVGFITGGWMRVCENSNSYNGESSYVLYDYKARPIRNYRKNYLGGFTQTDMVLDFKGKTTKMVTAHKRLAADEEIRLTDRFEFTANELLSKHAHQINTATATLPEEIMSENGYDELGMLISKKVGGTGTPLQKIDYSYNSKGWLKEINQVAGLQQGNDPLDLFAFKINYNTVENSVGGEIKAQFNGNISETFWKTANDNKLRKYGYSYDGMNRLKKAVYQKPGDINEIRHSYDEELTYDRNGNITSLKRNGDLDDALEVVEIDDLGYSYEQNTNRLARVTDLSNNASGFRDGTNTDNDYSYDVLGNLKTDKNKNITGIKYNHLNLPVEILLGGNLKINYIYDASGNKVRKILTDNAIVNTIDYMGGFHYKNQLLSFIQTSEGYISNTSPGIFQYVYSYRDHLGNSRLGFVFDPISNQVRIAKENHFYPFGMKHQNYNTSQLNYVLEGKAAVLKAAPGGGGGNPPQAIGPLLFKYEFQGQERQEDFGLNWDSFKWRNYDYAIGRFMSVDPLAEKYNWMSAYQFSSNQVIHAPEFEGMESYDDLNEDDLDFDHWLFGTDLLDSEGNQIHTPEFQLDEVLITNETGIGDEEEENLWEEEGNIEQDGLVIWGFGADPEAGSGDIKNDRGKGSIQADGHDFNTLFDFGKLIGEFFNYLFGNDKKAPVEAVAEPVVEESSTVVKYRESYGEGSELRGNVLVDWKVKDTTVLERDADKIARELEQRFNLEQERIKDEYNKNH